MKRTNTLIIGGGQAGLAMSYELGRKGIDNAIVERGQIAERWRSERWDSLKLLTPRWQSRLAGWSYQGAKPDGYMPKAELIAYLSGYARFFDAPVFADESVLSVEKSGSNFHVKTSQRDWFAQNVVIATGHCAAPLVPQLAKGLDTRVRQLTPNRYKSPDQLDDGGVLVVGGSSTGVQLASEIAQTGRRVAISVGRHIRLPRIYRGRDIMHWLDTTGVLTERFDEVPDIRGSRGQPSLQLVGRDDFRSIDIGTLHKQSIRILDRIVGCEGGRVYFGNDLAENVRHSDEKMNRLLDQIDLFIERRGGSRSYALEERPADLEAPAALGSMDLAPLGFSTVIWATGFRRSYPWLRIPVLDGRGELVHTGGVTPVRGLYAIGLNFMRRRNSSFIDGVGADAADLAETIFETLRANAAAFAC